MKKFFSTILLAVGIIFGSQFANISTVSAYYGGYDVPDYYAFTNSKGTAYYIYYVSEMAQQFDSEFSNRYGISSAYRAEVYLKGMKNGKSAGKLKYIFSGNSYSVFASQYNPLVREDRFSMRIETGSTANSATAKKILSIVRSGAPRNAQEKKEAAEKQQRLAKFNNLIAEGDKFYNAKNYDSAKNSYAKARAENNTEIENLCNALISNGNKLNNEENFAASVDYFRKAIVMGSSKADEGLYNSLVDAGRAADSNKKFDEAINSLNEAINFKPNNSWAYIVLGVVYNNMEQYEKAIENYNKALQISPNYTEAYICRGLAYGELKNYQKAIDDYTQAIKLNPNDANAYNNRAWTYYLLKNYKQALKDSNKAIKLDKNNADAYDTRGNVYKALGKNDLAEKDFAKAKELGHEG